MADTRFDHAVALVELIRHYVDVDDKDGKPMGLLKAANKVLWKMIQTEKARHNHVVVAPEEVKSFATAREEWQALNRQFIENARDIRKLQEQAKGLRKLTTALTALERKADMKSLQTLIQKK
jgi:hypothetical protein